MRALEQAPTTPPAAPAVPGWAAPLAGLAAAALALATGELVAGLLDGPSPVVAVGDRVIDLAPPAVKDVAIAAFGTANKAVLITGILTLSAACGALLGWVAARRFAAGAGGLLLFGVLGTAAGVADPQASVLQGTAPSIMATAAGVLALRRAVPPRAPGRAGAGDPGSRREEAGRWVTGFDRRAFLRGGLVLGAVAVGVTASGRWLQALSSAAASRAQVVLGRAVRPLPPVPAAADLGVDGMAPFITPNADFFRIDTALQVPRVTAGDWQLRVTGMVERPLTLTFEALQARDLVEADVTLACVSNEVGGDLVGTARWLGVRLDDLLAEAGIRPGATQIVGRSVDGFTAGFPTEVGLDGRDALVAIGMNGEPLPIAHGFPARLVVPGLYGYVSATKWLAEIELTTLEASDGYWVPRGWAKEAPIKTQSRVDVPSRQRSLRPGPTAVAGVAWAPTRGIARVEVQVDEGAWAEARLAGGTGPDTWRQWVYEWDATPGEHRLRVRATDGTGRTQPEQRTPPAPDGASGWHTVTVTVQG